MRAVWVLPLLLAASLAGCTHAPSGAAGAVPALDFGPMAVTTVPLEPAEGRGVISLSWQDGRMAVATHNEGGMPAQAVADGGTLYVTDAGMGWTAWDKAAYVSATARGFRYLAWDVPGLLAHAQVVQATPTWFRATASYQTGHHGQPVTIDVNHTGPAIRDVRIATSQDPESPYTLTPAAQPFPFPVAVPSPSRPVAEVAQLDGKARDAHAVVLGLVAAYAKDHGGTLPDTLGPDSLRVEMVSSGAQWPTSPYDGQPLREAAASGHFHWVHCALGDGQYEGYGWDGAAVRYAFGKGCA